MSHFAPVSTTRLFSSSFLHWLPLALVFFLQYHTHTSHHPTDHYPAGLYVVWVLTEHLDFGQSNITSSAHRTSWPVHYHVISSQNILASSSSRHQLTEHLGQSIMMSSIHKAFWPVHYHVICSENILASPLSRHQLTEHLSQSIITSSAHRTS